MLNIQQLKKYLFSHHHIKMKPTQLQTFRNLGYYHGYKGYRFIKKPSQKILFSNFTEIIAINEFDMHLKALFYPKVMYIETALKNYVIEATLQHSHSENFDVIFNHCITKYKSFVPGSNNYIREYTKRMILKGKINSALIRDYGQHQQIVEHFFNNDKPIPIWAIFESLTLGEFGTFFSCSCQQVKLTTSALLNLPKNLDSDGLITEYIIYTIKDLRNSIAHNNVIFDTRFQTGSINSRLIHCLKQQTHISSISFSGIEDYLILIIYILRNIGVKKTECKSMVNSFSNITESLRSKLPINMYNQIISTGLRTKLNLLNTYIVNS